LSAPFLQKYKHAAARKALFKAGGAHRSAPPSVLKKPSVVDDLLRTLQGRGPPAPKARAGAKPAGRASTMSRQDHITIAGGRLQV
jgi:hypothetical protein